MLAFDTADELDGDPQEVLRGRLVEPGLPDEPREDELGRLVDRSSECGGDRAKDALGHRDEVLGGAAHLEFSLGFAPTAIPPKAEKPLRCRTGASSSAGHRRVDRDTAGERLHVGLDPPSRRDANRDPPEERADLEARVRSELCVSQIDGDPAEPREHRAAPERLRAALHRDAVQDRDEPDLVALGVAS